MKTALLVGFTLLTFLDVDAQTFSSGSTGADGAFDPTSGDQTQQLPESGILNFTTVNAPLGRTLRFQLNSANTPVVMLAQGDVRIDVSGRIEAANFDAPQDLDNMK
jgi:hypothetical protein